MVDSFADTGSTEFTLYLIRRPSVSILGPAGNCNPINTPSRSTNWPPAISSEPPTICTLKPLL